MSEENEDSPALKFWFLVMFTVLLSCFVIVLITAMAKENKKPTPEPGWTIFDDQIEDIGPIKAPKY